MNYVYTFIAAAIAAFMFMGIGYNLGREAVQREWDKAKAATVELKLDTKGTQDEIQNAPIDVDVTMRRLLNGSF